MKCIFTCLIVLCICFSSASARSYLVLYEDYISDDPSLPHCNDGVFEGVSVRRAKCGCSDSETKTLGELVRIQDRSIIYRGTPIYKAQCISRRITKIEGIRRMTEHRLLDELLQRRMEALEETGDGFEGRGLRGRKPQPLYSGSCCKDYQDDKLSCDRCLFGFAYSERCGDKRYPSFFKSQECI